MSTSMKIFRMYIFFRLINKKTMKSVFNNQVQKVRDGVNDLLHTNREPQHYPQTSTIPSGAPTYYHLSSNPSPVDPYSHTAHSTAGFSQTGTYPTLTTYNQPADRQV